MTINSSKKAILDQLKDNLSKADTDQKKIDLYLEVGKRFGDFWAEKCVEVCKTALELAEKNNDLKRKGAALNLLGHAFISLNKYDKGVKVLTEAKAIVLDDETDNIRHIFTNSYQFGRMYFFTGDLIRAQNFNTNCLEIAEKLEDNDLILLICTRLALTAYRQGDMSQSKLHIIKGLSADNEAITVNHGHFYNAVGIVYNNLEIYDKSLSYYEKALDIWEKTGHDYYSGRVYNNMGIMYQSKKDRERANDYYEKAIEWYKKIDDNRNVAITYCNIGENLQLVGKHEEAIKYFKNSLEICEPLKDKYQIANSHYYLALSYFEIKKPANTVKKHLDTALVLSNEINNKLLSKFAFELYSKLHLLEQDIPQALEYQTKYLEINDEISKQNIIEVKQSQDEMEKKIDRINAENAEIKSRVSNVENLLAKTFEELQKISQKLG